MSEELRRNTVFALAAMAAEASREASLAVLRARVSAIERSGSRLDGSARPAWRLGDAEIDRLLGGGLDGATIHEVKPQGRDGAAQPGASAAAGWASARAFALALACRRLSTVPHADARILWVSTTAMAGELGVPYGPGLAALGFAPERLLLATPRRTAEALWAMEEGLRAGSLALVVGLVDEVALTPARRLALAAAASATPCLLLTHPRSAPAAATATRWRVGPTASRPARFDPKAPGGATFTLRLERCRARPATADAAEMHVEWSDAAHRFRLVPELRHRPAAPRHAGRRSA